MAADKETERHEVASAILCGEYDAIIVALVPKGERDEMTIFTQGGTIMLRGALEIAADFILATMEQEPDE